MNCKLRTWSSCDQFVTSSESTPFPNSEYQPGTYHEHLPKRNWTTRGPVGIYNTVDMVNIPVFIGVLYIPGGCLGFLNHQQYQLVIPWIMVPYELVSLSSSSSVHPRKLTWIPKIAIFKRSHLFEAIILGIHVRFPGCIISTFIFLAWQTSIWEK